MKTIKTTTTYNGLEIIVEATFGDEEKTINADGDIVNLGSEFKKTIRVKICKDGKQLAAGDVGTMFCNVLNQTEHTPKGAYARVGDQYISQATWDVIAKAIADVDMQITEPETVQKNEVKLIKNPAYAHLTDAQIKEAEENYDNLQNEGYKEGFNSYRDMLFIADN